MFWSEEQTRHLAAVNEHNNEQRLLRSRFTTTGEEAKRDAPDIGWLVKYERAADARKAAWEA